MSEPRYRIIVFDNRGKPVEEAYARTQRDAAIAADGILSRRRENPRIASIGDHAEARIVGTTQPGRPTRWSIDPRAKRPFTIIRRKPEKSDGFLFA